MATTTLYVSRRVPLPALAAAVAFDELCAPACGLEPAACTLVAPPARLRLRRPHGASGPDLLAPVRTSIGRLRRAPGGPGYAVEVGLTHWSAVGAEVGIRPRGGAAPLRDGRRQASYLALADRMVGHLAARLEAIAAGWEHDVVREAAALVRDRVGA
jgi:hypothetical protein